MNATETTILLCTLGAIALLFFRKPQSSSASKWRFCIRCERFFNGKGEIRQCVPFWSQFGPKGVCNDCAGDLHYREF